MPKIDHASYVVGNIVHAAAATVEEGKTNPPAYYTQASVLLAMANAHQFAPPGPDREMIKASGGIGTARTRETPITELLRSGFAVEKGSGTKRHLEDSEAGRMLNDIAPAPMRSVVMTGKWETMLGMISGGRLQAAQFMKAIEDWTAMLVKDAEKKKAEGKFRISLPQVTRAPSRPTGGAKGGARGGARAAKRA